jgi:putative ABC transport system substrate-binding protein
VRTPEDFEATFAAIKKNRAGALFVLADTMFFAQRSRLAELAARTRIPAIYGVRDHAEVGGLMVYTANVTGLFRRAATYVDN